MTTPEKIYLIEGFIGAKRECDKYLEKRREVTGGTHDSLLRHAVYGLEGAGVAALAAGVEGKVLMRPVRTVARLVKLIENTSTT